MTSRGYERAVLATALAAALLTACGGGGGSDAASSASQLAAALPDGNVVGIGSQSVSIDEAARQVRVPVLRTGAGNGATAVDWQLLAGTATEGQDFLAAAGTLHWDAGDNSPREIAVTVLSDLLDEGSESLTLRLSNLVGEEMLANAAVGIDIVDSTCSATLPSSIGADSTLTHSCYRMTGDVFVTGSAQLTVPAGTQVIADPGTRLALQAQSVLNATGTASLPTIFTAASPGAAGRWQGLRLDGDSPLHRLSHSHIEGADVGVDIAADARFAALDHTTFVNIGRYAASLPLHATQQLGAGNRFPADRGIEIRYRMVRAGESVTIPAIDGHYVSSQSLIVDGHLDIAPGVDLRFANGTRVYISNAGSLTANGEADAPITLHGVSPLAGAWDGIQWVSSASPDNRLSHTTVADAGGDPTRPGNLVIEGDGTALVLETVTLENSAGYGLLQLADVADITFADLEFGNNALGDWSN